MTLVQWDRSCDQSTTSALVVSIDHHQSTMGDTPPRRSGGRSSEKSYAARNTPDPEQMASGEPQRSSGSPRAVDPGSRRHHSPPGAWTSSGEALQRRTARVAPTEHRGPAMAKTLSGRRRSPRRQARDDDAGGAIRLWSDAVTRTSNALDLEPGVFTWDDPDQIARSLLRSAQASTRRKGTPYQSAMSMLTFFINRAGKSLPAQRRRVLEQAKDELRKRRADG